MPRFIKFLAKTYDPSNIDGHIFAMNISAPHCIPLISTSFVNEKSGSITVDGKSISSGKCVKFDFSPLPFFLIPVGEIAREYGKSYEVKLEGFTSDKGRKFRDCTFTLKTEERDTDDGRHQDNEQAAKDVSDEGIVLLANDGILPLEEGSEIALAGEYEDYRISSVGAGLIKPRWQLTIQEALEKSFVVKNKADTALFVISRDSGENKDNRPVEGQYYLTEQEKKEISDTFREHPNVILILNTGYPIETEYLLKLPFKAIVWTGFSGQRGTESLTDILCGKVNPSGRLADTWPLDYYDSPSSKNFINQSEDFPVYSDDGRKHGVRLYYEEEQFIGYRYFDTFEKPCAFPFGHGLSYTSFSVESNGSFGGTELSVEAKVENTGRRSGKNSVLIYVSSPKGRLKKPKRVFCGFEKTELLEPGCEQTLTIKIPAKDFAVYDDSMHVFLLEKGEYSVNVGGSIKDAKKAFAFNIEEDLIVEHTVSVCAPVEKIGGINEEGEVESKSSFVESDKMFAVKAEYRKAEFPNHKPGRKVDFHDVVSGNVTPYELVSQFSVKELARFAVCDGSCFRPDQSGAAGRLPHSDKYGIPTFYMSDGNCGVNLNRKTTGFPSSNMLAGTFNKKLAYLVGEVLAKESKEYGISINLGPGGNLHRNILCGRHPEYFSEDPILAGILMAYQAKGLEENGTMATYKHLFANGSELERKSSHGIIGERTLRELYLRVFDKALSIYKPSCIMTSYNAVNGIYPSENKELLQDLLRKEWGFEGFIMTDWGSCDSADAVSSVNAGTNLLTPGDKKLYKKILRAAKKGEIEKGTLQESTARVIGVLSQCYNFEKRKNG